MKVGIIGSGIVGRVLGNAFLREGHAVMIGTRDTSKEDVVRFISDNPTAQAGSFADAARFGEVVVLATGGGVTLDAVELAGKENFNGKVVIDTTNPIASEPPVNGGVEIFYRYQL